MLVSRPIGSWPSVAPTRPASGWILAAPRRPPRCASAARRSYERATQIDSQYAAAYLRLGSLDAQEGRRAEAQTAIENAERLYKIASNPEGEAEALLRRGSFLNDLGEVTAARGTLERAATLASSMGSQYHDIRSQLQLAAVTASEGRLRDAGGSRRSCG